MKCFNVEYMSFFIFLKIFNLLFFYGYGLTCFFSKRMKLEFFRYGFPQYRILIGILQVMGSTGLLLGLYFKFLTLVSSMGLAILMFLAIGIRIKIHDSLFTMIPAFLFMCLNLFIFSMSLFLGNY